MTDPTIEKLIAESGVRDLQGRYVDAVWRKDFDAFADCFTGDAEWRIAGQVFRGPAECAGVLRSFIDQYDRVRMVLQPPLVELSPGGAVARTHVIEHNFLRAGGQHLALGVYHDRVLQQGARWRFAWHYYQLYYFGPPDMSGKFYELKDFGPPVAMPAADEPTAAV
jgi:ketosteroid isomerase-like protein